MFRLDERDSTAETPVVGDGRREMSMELETQETWSYPLAPAPRWPTPRGLGLTGGCWCSGKWLLQLLLLSFR